VQDDPGGMDALLALGVKALPVVAVGEKFVIAQSLADVARLIGIDYDAGPELTPDELVRKLDAVLAAAARLVRQLPPERLPDDVKGRARSLRQLSYHIFRIVEAFLDVTIERGARLELDHLNAPVPDAMRSTGAIAEYGEGVRRRLAAWWAGEADRTLARTAEVYWGEQPLRDVLERTAWHPAQHVRQIASLLEEWGIAPDGPPTAEDLDGLPMPSQVWDA
jgi:uncharacterized damage-inducible protein DinB